MSLASLFQRSLSQLSKKGDVSQYKRQLPAETATFLPIITTIAPQSSSRHPLTQRPPLLSFFLLPALPTKPKANIF